MPFGSLRESSGTMFATGFSCKFFWSPHAVSRRLTLVRSDDRSAEVSEAIRSFQSGLEREQSFQLLFHEFFPAMERFFARKGFATVDCCDLAQETMVEVYRCLDDFRGEARFTTWLYRIATTTYLKKVRARDAAKRTGREISHDEASADEHALKTPATQLRTVLQDERRDAMRRAVEGLPEQMRKCLTLRLYHRLKYREIAEVMKLKIDTVKVHLFKGRKKLEEELQTYSFDDLSF